MADGLRIGMIWAQARGGAIGRNGTMPWHLPEDLAHFKKSTSGAPVIMGRKTWESLPERFRPLPERLNIVVTRAAGYEAQGAEVAMGLEEAFAMVDPLSNHDVDAWIMGGGELYKLAMPAATKLVVTQIEIDVADADTFAPEIEEDWVLRQAGPELITKSGVAIRFEEYERRGEANSGSLEE